MTMQNEQLIKGRPRLDKKKDEQNEELKNGLL